LSEAGLWQLKLEMYLVLTIAFCVGYFSVQRFPLFQSQTLPLTFLDRAIGFHPQTIYLYQSVYLLVPLFPFLAWTRQQLMQYALGFASLCLVCFLIFAFVPIAGPRPERHRSRDVSAADEIRRKDQHDTVAASRHCCLLGSVRVSALADGARPQAAGLDRSRVDRPDRVCDAGDETTLRGRRTTRRRPRMGGASCRVEKRAQS
jgi:hypothetical protein